MNILTLNRKIWLVMSICFLTTTIAKSQNEVFKWPDSPASQVFQDFVKSFNSGKEKIIRTFVKTHYEPSNLQKENNRVEYWMDFYYRFGEITPYEISINKPYDLEVWMQGTVSKSWFAPEFIIDEKTNKIKGQAMLQGVLPEGINLGSINQEVMLKSFKEYLEKNTSEGLFQGSVYLQKGNEILLSKGYGFKNVEQKTRNTIDTRFRISSIMKSITAIACLKLSQEGLLNINIPISKYLPELPKHISSKITVSDLLGHTSGYELDGIDGFRAELEKTKSMQEVYQLQLKFLPKWEHYQTFNPDYKYDYANDSFDLVAIIIEKITGMNYEDYLKKFLFEPSGMIATSFEADKNTGFYRYDLAHGGLKNYALYYPNTLGKVSGAGSIVSSVGDLKLFFNTLLKTNKILDLAHRSVLFSPRVVINEATNLANDEKISVSIIKDIPRRIYNSYGQGIFINYDSALNIGHSGSNIGNTSQWCYFPKEDYLLIVVSNNRNGAKNAYNYFKNLIPRK